MHENPSLIHQGCITRKSEVTGPCAGEEDEVVGAGVASPSTFDSALCRPGRGSHTRWPALAPRSPPPLRTMAVSVVHGEFFPIVSCLCWSSSSLMDGRRGQGCHLGSGRHFYETKILMGDPCGSARHGRGHI